MKSRFVLIRWISLASAVLVITLGCQTLQIIQEHRGKPTQPDVPGTAITTQPGGGAPVEPGTMAQITLTPGVGLNQHFKLAGQIGGNSYALAVQGNTAYLGVGPRLVVLDLSNPGSPQRLGESEPLPGVVRGIAVRPPYAYVAADKGKLRVLDISQPQQPVEVGALEAFQYAMAVLLEGSRAYIADNAQGLWIADISNPTQPRLLGTIQLKQPAASLVVVGDTAYIVHMGGGLVAIDASDPQNPMKVGELALPQMSMSMALCGGYACIAAGFGGLWVVDISNPADLKQVAELKMTDADGIAVDGNLAYVTDMVQGLAVIDVSNPFQPVQVGALALTLFSQGVPTQRQIVAQGGQVLLANPNQGLLVVGASNPKALRLLGSYDAPLSGAAFDVEPTGSTAFVTRDFIGLGAVEVSNPANLRFLGSESSFVKGAPVRTSWKLALAGKYAVMADVNLGFRVIDLSNLAQMSQVAGIAEPRSLSDVILQGNIAYVSSVEHDPPQGDPKALRSLRTIDISNPLNPQQVGLLKMEHNTQAMAILGNYLFYPDMLEIKELSEGKTSAMHVIDISNPANPVQVGEIDTTSLCPVATSLVMMGNIAYVGDQSRGMCLYDISNPANPQDAGTFKDVLQLYDMALVGERIYTASYGYVAAIDISNPLAPQLADYTITPGLAWGIGADDQYIYVASMDGGLNLLTYK